jgi:hypothetical protein
MKKLINNSNNMKNIKLIISSILCVVFFGFAPNLKQKIFVPHNGFVPDERTAIKIAEAIWYPIYGDEIYDEKPFKAELNDSVWIVHGTLNYDVGGIAYIEIQKSDCKILRVTHGK